MAPYVSVTHKGDAAQRLTWLSAYGCRPVDVVSSAILQAAWFLIPNTGAAKVKQNLAERPQAGNS